MGIIDSIAVELTAAQVIFPGDGGPETVRLNWEVKAGAIATLLSGDKMSGDAVTKDDIEIQRVVLSEAVGS